MSHTYELLALDLDGTLTNARKEVTPHTVEVLHQAIRQGTTVALTSGRPAIGIWPVARTLELDRLGGYILACNGGHIIDCATGQDLFRAVFPPRLIPEAVALARENQIAIVTYDHTHIITEGPVDEYVEHESFNNHLPVKQVPDLPAYVGQLPLVKMVLCGPPERIAQLEPVMAAHFAGQLDVYQAEPVFLELMPLGIRKSTGLERLMARLHLGREQLMACGDGNNDLDMIRLAGLGVAMGNAAAPVKAAADFVTCSNEEDGVAAAVEAFLLKGDPSR